MKLFKRILISLLCLLLAGVIALCAVEFWYLPHYISHKRSFDIAENQDESCITLMSANVRCISPTDLFKESWFYRADLIVKNIESVCPDVIGFQEVTKYHYKYLTESLSGYDSVITYRDDSLLAESCPVFYNTAKFDLTDKGSFWLSETPEVMSKSWGAAFNRVCSYVILSEKATGKPFVVFNTHLDHVSEQARINGIKLILQKIEVFGGYPSVIMGDFNTGETKETYLAATALFNDAKYQTENTMTGATFQQFGRSLDHVNLDYFMISKTGITVNEYRIITTTYDGVYPSDHFPIMLKMNLD